MEDLDEAGGIPAVLKELENGGLINTDCMTVTGRTVKENLEKVLPTDGSVIRPLSDPFSKTGGIAVLKGNLAKDGCVVKRSAVAPKCCATAERPVSSTAKRKPSRSFTTEE